jgi:hypothetical protein
MYVIAVVHDNVVADARDGCKKKYTKTPLRSQPTTAPWYIPRPYEPWTDIRAGYGDSNGRRLRVEIPYRAGVLATLCAMASYPRASAEPAMPGSSEDINPWESKAGQWRASAANTHAWPLDETSVSGRHRGPR